MDTKIPDKTADVREVKSAPRVTPTQPKTHFKEVFAATAVRGAEQAMTMLPGGPVMALALRGAPAVPMPMSTMSGTATLGGGIAGTNVGAQQLRLGSATGAGAAEGPGTPAGGVDPLTGQAVSGGEQGSIEGSLQQSQEMNLYYLQIQEAVNAQNRSFTALSNVIKAEHDTVKTAIGNIH
jgi:hypothetical protein